MALADYIRDLGGVSNHQCLLVHPTDTSADGIEEPLREAFGSLEIHTYQPRMKGWPFGPNEMFAQVAMLIANDARFGDFLLVETDCVPRGVRWLDTIAADYRICGQPMMGVTTDTVALDNGISQGGRHTVGVAVYPKLFARMCPLVKYVVSMSEVHAAQKKIPLAFDCYFGPYTAPHTAETRLIQHLYRSKNFREENGQIIGDVPFVSINTVHPEAMLIHGVKDDSLLNILRGQSGKPQNGAVAIGFPVISKSRVATGADDSHKVVEAGSIPAPAIPKTPKDIAVAAEAADSYMDRAFASVECASRPYDPSNITNTPIPQGQGRSGKRIKPTYPPPTVGPDGRVMPPFVPGHPECVRHRELCCEMAANGYRKLQKYAKTNLKIITCQFRKGAMTREVLLDAIVLKEREMRKLPWAKKLPKPLDVAATTKSETSSGVPVLPVIEAATPISAPPQALVSAMPQWGEVKPDESGISPAMREKMLQMRRERGMATA